MNGRQIFWIHIVLKCQRSSEARTFARLQYFCTFVIEIKDQMQYCMEEPKQGCRARALGTGSLYALRAALCAGLAGVNNSKFGVLFSFNNWCLIIFSTMNDMIFSKICVFLLISIWKINHFELVWFKHEEKIGHSNDQKHFQNSWQVVSIAL